MTSLLTFSVFFSLLLIIPDVLAAKSLNQIKVDLSGPGCDLLDGQFVGDWDIIRVFHQPNFNAISTRDLCVVTLRADNRRRLQYSIDTLEFFECGVEINIYDDPRGNFNPKHQFKCNNKPVLPIRAKSAFDTLTMEIRRTNPTTTNYDFAVRVMNDMELATSEFPTGKSFDKVYDDYEGEALDPGIIAGIGIAGAIIIVALILLAIYLCMRARQASLKDDHDGNARDESTVYTSGNSKVLFPTKDRQPRGRYGSMEDINSTASQEKAGSNGTYSNRAYNPGPREKGFERQASFGRAGGKARYDNRGFVEDDGGSRTTYDSWQEDEVKIGSFRRANNDKSDVNIGSFRRSRRDEFQQGGKKLKSALKKPTELEMNRVNTQPNSILKAPRTRSPNRSQTSSTEGSYDHNALVHGYSHANSKTEHPNIKHKPILERRRSRSGTRSNRSTSSAGSHGRRSQSADRKQKPKPNSRMYQEDVFIASSKPRSSSRSRARSNSLGRRRDRGSDSIDSESSATSSRRVNMNPGGKRVHIKGEETDI